MEAKCVSGGKVHKSINPLFSITSPWPGEIQVLPMKQKFPEALDLRVLSTCEHNTQEIDTTHCCQKRKRSSPFFLALFFKTWGLAVLRTVCAANHVGNDPTTADSGNIILTFLLSCPVLTDGSRSPPANPIWISNQRQWQSSCSFTVEHSSSSNGMCALNIFREKDAVKRMKLNSLLQLWAGCFKGLQNVKGFVLSESRKKYFK